MRYVPVGLPTRQGGSLENYEPQPVVPSKGCSNSMLKTSSFSPAQPWRAETRLSPCVVLGSSKSSTGTRPLHHSAARADVVLLIRRTVRHRGYACWTAVLSILRPISDALSNKC